MDPTRTVIRRMLHEGMLGDSLWFNPETGEWIDLGNDDHSIAIVHDPEKFGMTYDEIEAMAKEYNDEYPDTKDTDLAMSGVFHPAAMERAVENGWSRVRVPTESEVSVSKASFAEYTTLEGDVEAFDEEHANATLREMMRKYPHVNQYIVQLHRGTGGQPGHYTASRQDLLQMLGESRG